MGVVVFIPLIPVASAQTDEIPPWQHCSAGTEPSGQCSDEGRLAKKALSDAYMLMGISTMLQLRAAFNNGDPPNDRQRQSTYFPWRGILSGQSKPIRMVIVPGYAVG
jgi:hypothetical protein